MQLDVRTFLKNGADKGCEGVLVTPAIAAEWLEEYKYEAQRPINRRVIVSNVAKMRAGKWEESFLLDFSVCDGKAYLTDGQHRLTSVVEAQVPIYFNVSVIKLPDMKAVGLRYAVIDSGALRRPIYGLQALGVFDKTTFNRAQGSQMLNALSLIDHGFSRKKGRAEPVTYADAIIAWAGYGYEYYDLVAHTELSKILGRATPLGIGLLTLRDVPEKAREFWYQVSQDDGLLRGDARKTLNRWLQTRRAIKRTDNTIARDINSEPRFAYFLAKTWNRWCKGETVDSLRGPRQNGSTAFTLLHTRYDSSKPGLK